jgi:Zn finger protein HypA/HybF involved in hydrogenase expression
MGSQVIAICKCGVNKSILIGGGMRTFESLHYFPCLCRDCEEVVQSNLKQYMYKPVDLFSLLKMGESKEMREEPVELPLKDRKLTCPKCKGQNVIPYNDERIKGELGNRDVIVWGDNVLTNGAYYCPKCKEMNLKFLRSFYMWD